MNLCPTCSFTKDGPLHRDYCRDSPLRRTPLYPDALFPGRQTAACPCECNEGGFCGGCGHAGCGGRSTPRRDHLR